MAIPEGKGHLRGESGPGWILNMSQLLHLQRHLLSPEMQAGQSQAQRTAENQPRGPLASNTSVCGCFSTAWSVPGAFLFHLWAPRKLPTTKFSVPQNFYEKDSVCVSSAPNFHLVFLLLCICLHMRIFVSHTHALSLSLSPFTLFLPRFLEHSVDLPPSS